MYGIRKQDFEITSGNRTGNHLQRADCANPWFLQLLLEGKSSNSDLLIPDNSLFYFNPSLFLSYAVSVSMILIHFLIEQRVAQNLTQLKVKGQQFLSFRRKPSLNLIRLLRVVSTPSVTSESTGCYCRPVTSLLLDLWFNLCKK